MDNSKQQFLNAQNEPQEDLYIFKLHFDWIDDITFYQLSL